MTIFKGENATKLHKSKSRIEKLYGVFAFGPLFIFAWSLGVFGGLLSSYLFELIGIKNMAVVGTRVFQVISYFYVFSWGSKYFLRVGDINLINHKNPLREISVGLAIGSTGVGMSFLIMVSYNMLTIEELAWFQFEGLNYCLIVLMHVFSNFAIAFIEEIPFRGYLANYIDKEWGSIWAIVGSGLIFSLWHLPFVMMEGIDAGLWLMLELVPLGILLSWAYIRSCSIWLVIAIHASYNFMQQALDIYGKYGDSGVWNNIVFLGTSTHGSKLLVGTAEGSAGLMQLMSSVVIIAITIVYIKVRKKQNT